MTSKNTAPDLAALVNEELTLAAAAEQIAERRATIKATLIDNLPIGSHDIGDHTVQVRAGARRVDPGKVAANHPYEQSPELYKHTVDTTAVKHHLAPAELDGYKTDGQPTVVVK
ncbi:hypothetical protein [Demequina flava]|uniref:hypothetical protein n=1 Tax=Demequina flava TaxID=1095025 RepID=UPI0007848EAB|nr:hypothetical protein [Demequina flava]